MSQSLKKSTRNIKKVNYRDPTPTPTPTPPPTTKSKTYRGKEFILPQIFQCYHRIQQQRGITIEVPNDGGLSFKLLDIIALRRVDDQSQIKCVSLTDQGECEDVVLRDKCSLWWYLSAVLKYKYDAIRIGFIEKEVLDKLEYKHYKCLYNVNTKLYHQLVYRDQKRVPQPIKCKIDKLEPDTHAGQNGDEYKIITTEQRKHNGKTVRGGWTSEFWLDHSGETWKVSELSLELQIARKSARFHNIYYIENFAKLINRPSDLIYSSAFWRKPEKYELYKNSNVTGFNGILCKEMLYGLMKRVFLCFCNTTKFNGYLYNVVIKNIRNNIYLYGESFIEYIFDYGIVRYLGSIGVKFEFDDEYITFIIKKQSMKKEFNLSLIQKNKDHGEFTLNSNVKLKYHRNSSRVFVSNFVLKLENRHFIKAKKNGIIQ